VSELKNISGSSKLPYGTLVLGAEGIKNAIKSFDDAYVFSTPPISPLAISSEVGRCRSSRYRRKSDIENERLPPPVGERSRPRPRPAPAPVPVLVPVRVRVWAVGLVRPRSQRRVFYPQRGLVGGRREGWR
jgi:hypothetical protein